MDNTEYIPKDFKIAKRQAFITVESYFRVKYELTKICLNKKGVIICYNRKNKSTNE